MICIRCRRAKSVESFVSSFGKPTKMCNECRAIAVAYSAEYRIKNKGSTKLSLEEIKERNRKYRKKYYANNKERLSAQNKEWMKRNSERRRGYKKEYCKAHAEENRAQSRKFRKENPERSKENWRKWKLGKSEYLKSKARERMTRDCEYSVFSNQLTIDDGALPDNKGKLTVLCKKCGSRFIPTRTDVQVRVRALSSGGANEGNFYCSKKCKNSCPTYRRVTDRFLTINKSDRDQKWANAVKENDEFKCVICGATEDLEAHHILPVNTNPKDILGEENGITLCKKCHKKVHKLPWCTNAFLRKNRVPKENSK